MDIISLARSASTQRASDIHILAFNPPIFRIKGSLQPVADMDPLAPEEIEDAFRKIATPEQISAFGRDLELDFGYSIPEVGRIRCNVARQRGSISLVIRLLPSIVPSIDEMGLPQVCKELILRPRGLVLVTGPTGSGKSTTLSAMINHLNSIEGRRIITIEDPIEFVYSNKKCVITQRELGGDTKSFAEALRHVLRQDPDVILVGEMRDLETASAAIEAAETGHLVLTTGHAPSAPQTIERVIDLFPPHERPTVQSRLASLINGVLSQALVPRADGSGRIAAIEILLATPAVRSNIRDGKIFQLPNVMMTQAKAGMILLDTVLVNYCRKGIITRESAIAFCNDPEEVNKQLSGNMMS